MEGHPIESLIRTAMESIKDMIDVNTIVGEAVETNDGTVIIPVSRVAFGFAAGGGDFVCSQGDEKSDQQKSDQSGRPFSGGSGAGVSVQPVAFMIVGKGQVRLLPVNHGAMVERIIDVAPQIMEQMKNAFRKTGESVVVQPN